MHTHTRFVRTFASGAALLLVLACNRPVDTPADSHLARVEASGHLTMVCFPLQNSRFVRPKLDVLRERGLTLIEMHDADGYEGADVDLVRGFADYLGVVLKIQSVTTNYADVIKSVADGEGDLAASSLSITEERSKSVDFSAPTGSVWASVAVPLDSPVSSLADLQGKTGVGMRGSSQVEIFAQMAPQGVELTLSNFTLESYLAVTGGEVEFMLLDSAAGLGEPASDDYSEVKIALRLAETLYGVAFPKGSDLRPRFNEYLAQRDSSD